MQTPSIHILASMDAVAEYRLSMDLARSLISYEIVECFGSHFIPQYPTSVNALEADTLCRESVCALCFALFTNRHSATESICQYK